MGSRDYEIIHLNKETVDFDDEVGATFLGYFDEAKPTEPVFDFGDANIRELTKQDVLKTVDKISLAT